MSKQFGNERVKYIYFKTLLGFLRLTVGTKIYLPLERFFFLRTPPINSNCKQKGCDIKTDVHNSRTNELLCLLSDDTFELEDHVHVSRAITMNEI